MRTGSPLPKSSSCRPRSPRGGHSPPRKRARSSHARERISQIVLPTFEEGDELEDEGVQIDDQSDSDDDDTLQGEQETVTGTAPVNVLNLILIISNYKKPVMFDMFGVYCRCVLSFVGNQKPTNSTLTKCSVFKYMINVYRNYRSRIKYQVLRLILKA